MSTEEDAQQRITYLLQEIDANICAAHRSATQICGTVRRHHQILRQIHDTSQLWRPLFDSFTQQPAAAPRRLTRTPGRFSRSTPGPLAASQGGGEQQRRETEAGGEEEEEASIVGSEQTFKTTKLKTHKPPPSEQRSNDEDSLNFSINSDNLPRMSRTPYLSKSAGRSDGGATHESASTLNSQDRSDWSPTMTSPPRTGIITQDHSQQQPRTSGAGARQISTPPSAISSVAYNSPGVSKNLMKVGAFEYTPPRGGKGRSTDSVTEPMEEDDSNDSIATPPIPRFSTVPTPYSIQKDPSTNADAPGSSTSNAPATRSSEGGGSGRKRKLSDSNEKHHTPSYPKTHYPGSPPAFSSPSLRRKFSTGGYSTPSRRRKSQARTTPVKETPTRQSSGAAANDDEDFGSPEFDLASPLLRTQLKAMSPHTPLSNRLVGANLDVGSISQEAKVQDYDNSFNSGEPAPKFELALFPAAFQRGVGAVQISTLYSKFQGADDTSKPAISVDQLADMLPDYGKEKLEILLDTLVSRRLLRPFVVEGTMFWQQPV